MASTGDWLLTRARTDSLRPRRGQILEVRGHQGRPPYLVRWADTGAQALVFPGSDTQVMSEADLSELDRQHNQRVSHT